MRAGGDGQPLRGSETSDGSDVRCQIIAPASPPIHPAAGPQLFFENPVIVINLRDLSTPRSCSDFADRVMRHANTARDDDIRQVSDGVAAQLLRTPQATEKSVNPSLLGKSREAVKGSICREAAGPQLSTLFPQLFSENPVIVINLRDLSTHRSCSDFGLYSHYAAYHRSR